MLSFCTGHSSVTETAGQRRISSPVQYPVSSSQALAENLLSQRQDFSYCPVEAQVEAVMDLFGTYTKQMFKRTDDSMKPLPYHWSESVVYWMLCIPLLQPLCPEEKLWGAIQKSFLMVPAWEPTGTMLAPRTDLCCAEHEQVEGLPGEGLAGTHGPQASFSWREVYNHAVLPGFTVAPHTFMLHQLGTLSRSV